MTRLDSEGRLRYRFLGDLSILPPHSKGTLDLNPLLHPSKALLVLCRLDLQWVRRLLAALPSRCLKLVARLPSLREQVAALAPPAAPTTHHQARHH